jgi:NADH-quinone oxidoreductase subunit M
MAACASLGILLGASYFLWTLQRMFFGKVNLKGGAVWQTALVDLNIRERIALFPLTLMVLALGLMPSLVFGKINDSVLAFVHFLQLK